MTTSGFLAGATPSTSITLSLPPTHSGSGTSLSGCLVLRMLDSSLHEEHNYESVHTYCIYRIWNCENFLAQYVLRHYPELYEYLKYETVKWVFIQCRCLGGGTIKFYDMKLTIILHPVAMIQTHRRLVISVKIFTEKCACTEKEKRYTELAS